MKCIDLNLFTFESLPIKCRQKEYIINQIPAALEIKILQIQGRAPEIIQSNFKSLTEKDITEWKNLIKVLLKENDNELIDEDIDLLSPLQVLTVISAIMKIIDKRPEAMQQIYQDDDKKKQE